MSKKWIAMLLALCMVLALMAGCGGSPAGSAPASGAEAAPSGETAEAPAAEEAPAEAAPAAEEAPAPEEASAEEPAEPEVQAPTNEFYSEHIGVKDYDLPLFDGEGYTFSIFWVKLGAMGGAEQPDKKDLLFWQRV